MCIRDRPVAENAFFWMLLLLLSIGCITSLYEKSLHKQETSSVSSESVFKSIKTTGRNYQIKERKLPIYCVKTCLLYTSTLFQVMTTLLQNAPENEPVYQFLNRKRSEGKPYYVYMTAGANKFLRIYYGKVKAHLRSLEQNE